jgi:hypothetical protein
LAYLLGALVVVLEGDLEKLVSVAQAVVIDGLTHAIHVKACQQQCH